MTEPFTAEMMDKSPSLLSSRFIQDVITHASTLAVSPLRPNGLNDLHVCVPSLAYILVHPEHEHGFSVTPLAPLSADATPVDRHNHTIVSADLLVINQAVQALKTFALSLVGSVISATLKHPTHGFTKLRLVDIIDHVTTNYGVFSRADLSIQKQWEKFGSRSPSAPKKQKKKAAKQKNHAAVELLDNLAVEDCLHPKAKEN